MRRKSTKAKAKNAAKPRFDHARSAALRTPPPRTRVREGRNRWWWIQLSVCLALGCEGANPCAASCSEVEGRYLVTYEPIAKSSRCEAFGLFTPSEELELNRKGSRITTTAAGISLSGTLFDDASFLLTGLGRPDGGGTETLDLRGTYLPPSTTLDAGARLRGNWSETHSSGSSGQVCQVELQFVATRQ